MLDSRGSGRAQPWEMCRADLMAGHSTSLFALLYLPPLSLHFTTTMREILWVFKAVLLG